MLIWFVSPFSDIIKNKEVLLHPTLSLNKTFYASASEAKSSIDVNIFIDKPIYLICVEVSDSDLLKYFCAALANYDSGVPEYNFVISQKIH